MPNRLLRLAAVAAFIGAAQPTAAAEGAKGGTSADANDPVVAKVDGERLRLSELAAAQQELPEQYRSLPLAQIFPALLERLIDGRLLAGAGRKQNLRDDPKVKARLRQLENRLIQEAYLSRLIDARVTDDALRRQYEETVKSGPQAEEVRARHILLKTEAEATAVIEELDGGGDFAALAKARSVGPSRTQGGDLGYFRRGDMVPAFSDAAYRLKNGAYTKRPVKSKFGWHVILVVDRRAKTPPSFEDSKAQLKEDLAKGVVQDELRKLRAEAKIERFAIDGTPPGAAADDGAKPAQPKK